MNLNNTETEDARIKNAKTKGVENNKFVKTMEYRKYRGHMGESLRENREVDQNLGWRTTGVFPCLERFFSPGPGYGPQDIAESPKKIEMKNSIE